MIIMIEETVGQLIKRIREEKGLSQNKLAMLSGIDRSYISQLESGKRVTSISLKTARALSSALKVQPEIFLSDDKTPIELPPKSIDNLFEEFKQKFEALEMIEVPIKGYIPAGYPCIKEEGNLGFAYVAKDSVKMIPQAQALYALLVQGESLIGDQIFPGDRLLVKPQSEVDVQGKIYICRLGNECTAKHVSTTPEGRYRLKATNDHFEDLEPSELEILGRALRNLGKDTEL